MVDAYSELLFAKFISATLLTLSSWFGLIAPFFIFRLIGAQHHGQYRSHSHTDATPAGSTLGNRRSAHEDSERALSGSGSNLTSATHHRGDDFPHAPTIHHVAATAAGGSSSSDYHGPSNSSLYDRNNVDSEWNAVAVSCANCVSAGILLWTGLMHFFVESAESFIANEKSHSIPDGLEQALLWFTIGILIPLVVERVLWPWLVDRLVPPSRSIAAVGVGCNLTIGGGATSSSTTVGSDVSTPREEPVSIAAMLVNHGHHHGHTRVSSATTDATNGATTMASPSPSPPAATQGHSRRSPTRRTRELAAAVLIAILMSVHSATEGVAVGVEQTVLSLKQSVTPLVVHKIFDGWLVGIGAFRASDSKIVSQSPTRAVKALFTTSPQRFSLIIWLAALPAFLLVIAPFVSPSSLPSAVGASTEQVSAQQRNVAPHLHSHPPASLTVAVAQATSSGSFVYVALCAILVDELSSTESIADGTKRVRKNVLLVSSAVVGLVLGSFLASGHD